MEFLSIFPQWTLYMIAGLIGAILGSFANVCIWRMPRGESVIWPASHCPRCDRKIPPWENVPLISYAILRGRCRGCGERISWRYPAIEALSIGLSLLTWWYFGEPIRYLVYFCLLIVPLIIASAIDLEHYILPDSITIPGIAVGFAAHVLLSGGGYGKAALDSVLGILVGGGALYLVALVYEKIKKQEGLGGGDVKLIAMLGAFFGWRAAILMLLVSSLLGSIVGIVLIIALRKDMKYAIPFGPFLALAGLVYLFAGRWLVGWYLGLFI